MQPLLVFAFRLARQFGCTLSELCKRMDAEEFWAWIALERVDPMPDPWLQTGILAASNANLWRGRKGRPRSPLDFIPRRKKRRQTPAEMRSALAILRRPKE